jgi:streptothricin hydrolase
MATALMVVDAQRNQLEGEGAVPAAATIRPALVDLLTRARAAGAVVVHVQNDGPPGYPDEPGAAGWALVFEVRDDELLVRKSASDALGADPGLVTALRERGVDHVVVAGLQSDYCIRATGRAGLQAGFRVTIPSGAHATYDDEAPAAELARAVEEELAAEGAVVVAAADVTFA